MEYHEVFFIFVTTLFDIAISGFILWRFMIDVLELPPTEKKKTSQNVRKEMKYHKL